MDDSVSIDVSNDGLAVLSGAMTIAQASQWLEPLRAALSAGASRLDLDAVSECDSAGVQLLLAARRSAAMQGQVLGEQRASQSVRDCLSRYGLLEQLTA